jgi:hypothetical protein
MIMESGARAGIKTNAGSCKARPKPQGTTSKI